MIEHFETKLNEVTELHKKIQIQLSDSTISAEMRVKLSKKFSSLEQVLECKEDIEKCEQELLDSKHLLTENSDQELLELARQDIEKLSKNLEKLYNNLKKLLIPKDVDDEKNAIIEIRAGTGGDEAAIFGNDLLRMYTRYAENQKWKMNILSSSYSETGGIKEIVVEISGEGTFSKLKHESGVHRVQRVPKTESQGRIHTSTATVAVLPKSEEIDIEIKDDDIRTDVFHSGGAGGQNVNKVATAIRLTHSPSGIVVSCQNERSQLQNKIQAMEILKSKLWDLEIQKQQNERSEARKSQVGSGGRSEKIRTYNYPQGRITDHRIKLTSHRLSEFMDGLIDEIIEPLMKDEQAKKMISNKSNE